MDKETRRLVRRLEKQNFEVVKTKQGHQTVRKNGVRVATVPAKYATYRRTKMNTLADLTRAGFTP